MHTIFTRTLPGRPRTVPEPSRATHGRRLGGAVSGFAGTLLTWQERARQRHALRMLDERMLKDIGVRRADALREVRKPFWRA